MCVISDIIGMARDRQFSTRGKLLDLLHHSRQHTVSLSRELIGVCRKRDIPSHRHRRRLLILLRIRRPIHRHGRPLELERTRVGTLKVGLSDHVIDIEIHLRLLHHRNTDNNTHVGKQHLHRMHSIIQSAENRESILRGTFCDRTGEVFSVPSKLDVDQTLLQ